MVTERHKCGNQWHTKGSTQLRISGYGDSLIKRLSVRWDMSAGLAVERLVDMAVDSPTALAADVQAVVHEVNNGCQ